MRLLPVALLALPVALAASARAAAPLLYVALGDSTAVGVGADQGGGYPDRIARRLAASGTQVNLVNLGAAGATADDVRREQLPKLLAERPALVTIGVGLNDVLRGRPLADYARDLEVIADAVARTNAAVVVSELPDVSRSPSGAGSSPSLARRLAAYNATLRRVAERHGFQIAEVEEPSRRAFRGRADVFAKDGFHPSARGYELWADLVWPPVERALAPRVQARRAGPPPPPAQR